MVNSRSFKCKNCGRDVSYAAPGTKNRNHCPFCLCSLHVDDIPGDRAATCHGVMPAIAKVLKNDGEEVLVHECAVCGFIRKNRIAGDDSFELVENLKIIDYFS